jgi:hypothetical protein
MTTEDMRYIQNDELNKSNAELLELVAVLRRQLMEELGYRTENSNALTAMAFEFQKNKQELEVLRKENKELKEALTHMTEKEQLKTKDIFGRGTEKLSDIFDASMIREEQDEAECEVIELPDLFEPESSVNQREPFHAARHKGKKQPGKRDDDLSKLPKEQKFLINFEELNRLHGEGNWRIAFWHCHRTMEHNPAVAYALETYTPVISVGLEHSLVSMPYETALLPRSFASASLVAAILFQKYFLAVPLYRQEEAFECMGVNLSRQTMCNWVLRFSFEYFGSIFDYMYKLLMMVSYHQCDETTLRVNKDGRKPGSKSYIWVHITSELLNTHPIILFCYELTRGTDHLRKFYKDFEGFISSDAYCSYQVLEKEKKDVIIVCGCMAHMRRRFVQSFDLINKSNMSIEAIDQLPETRALTLIGKIYNADEQLKNLSADKRKLQRDFAVRPLVKEYFNYIESLDTADPTMTNRLKDAINYSLNQKEHLCRFLEDGNIPIDNSASERIIKPFVIGRKNFLFCDSIDGAKATAIMYTIVETARANGANVYYYLRYVLEEMPRHMDDTDRSFMDAMLPWSAEYREYERIHTSSLDTIRRQDEYSSPPKTPRKKERGYIK